MSDIVISLGDRSYPIRILPGLLADAATHLAPFAQRGRLSFVTDANVAALYWRRIAGGLAGAGIKADVFILPPGESAKSWAELERLTDWLLDQQVERSSHVVALGGGVVGDITGFAASILKRGCKFVQIPTTLLAQVDSSVGGKTAINSSAGKNLVGAFHQPAAVLVDPNVLATLPRRELGAGYAEVVKYGLIDDAVFFGWCEANGAALMAGDAAAQTYAIRHSVTAKGRIVADDEFETTGKRALLNLGHTFGHALEAEKGFSADLLHGEAVAAGMVLAARYSVRLGLCPAADAERIAVHLGAVGLPVSLADCGIEASGDALVAHMLHDKKMAGGKLPFLLLEGIGQTVLRKDVELTDVAAFLDELSIA